MADQIKVVRRFVPDTPEEIERRRERIIAILRKYGPYLIDEDERQQLLKLQESTIDQE